MLPLLGMKHELELTGKVLYSVHPEPRNNYQQGVGVEFLNLHPGNSQLLERYIENYFMEELCHHNSYGWQACRHNEGGSVIRMPDMVHWQTSLASQAN